MGVYSFTIKAVSQDEFDDVKIPDQPAQAPSAGASLMTSSPGGK